MRCAFCRDAVDGSDETLTCPDCGTLVHGACQLELPACPTLGCGSVAPWEVVEREGAPVRAWRWLGALTTSLVVATAMACALIASPEVAAAPVVRTPSAVPTPSPARALSAWAHLGTKAVVVTRTERREPYKKRAFHCCDDDGNGCHMCTGWGRWLSDEITEQWYRVRWVVADEVNVEVRTSTSWSRRPPGLQEALTAKRSYFAVSRHATPLDGGRGELVTVPAGTFPAVYRRTGAVGTDRESAQVETWTASWCPVPLKVVRSWVEPGEPAELPTTETTVLARFEPGRRD